MTSPSDNSAVPGALRRAATDESIGEPFVPSELERAFGRGGHPHSDLIRIGRWVSTLERSADQPESLELVASQVLREMEANGYAGSAAYRYLQRHSQQLPSYDDARPAPVVNRAPTFTPGDAAPTYNSTFASDTELVLRYRETELTEQRANVAERITRYGIQLEPLPEYDETPGQQAEREFSEQRADDSLAKARFRDMVRTDRTLAFITSGSSEAVRAVEGADAFVAEHGGDFRQWARVATAALEDLAAKDVTRSVRESSALVRDTAPIIYLQVMVRDRPPSAQPPVTAPAPALRQGYLGLVGQAVRTAAGTVLRWAADSVDPPAGRAGLDRVPAPGRVSGQSSPSTVPEAQRVRRNVEISRPGASSGQNNAR